MLEFLGRYNSEKLFLKEFKYWIINLRENQVNVGSCVILLKRECPSIAQVREEEMEEFPLVCNWFETKCQQLFKAEKFNYLATMMKENFVHFHAIPRYSKEIVKYERSWCDLDWPKRTTLTKIEVNDHILRQMKEDFLK